MVFAASSCDVLLWHGGVGRVDWLSLVCYLVLRRRSVAFTKYVSFFVVSSSYVLSHVIISCIKCFVFHVIMYDELLFLNPLVAVLQDL